MGMIAIGARAKVLVVDIKENFDQFESKSSDNPGIRYCHLVMFESEGVQYKAQYCTVNPKLIEFGEGFILEIQITAHTKGVYTFNLLSAIPPKGSDKTYQAPKLSIITGTAAEISLRLAVSHHQDRISSDEAVLATAEKFKEWLQSNNN
jgi:hypothetical protein